MQNYEIDHRIKKLIQSGIEKSYRTMFAVTDDTKKDPVMVLHHVLSSLRDAPPSLLWCHKKDPLLKTGKSLKKLRQKIGSGKLRVNEEDPADLFLCSTRIRFCHYSDTAAILGRTYGMCVLQDWDALTPNLLARTIETVEGGGVVVLLLPPCSTLKELYDVEMDAHRNYRTESQKDFVCRFNRRFMLSLRSCPRCLVIDADFNCLPDTDSNLSNYTDTVPEPVNPIKETETSDRFRELQEVCKTSDQKEALLKLTDCFLPGQEGKTIVSLTAARGRGKSAVLGLAVSAAVFSGFTNVFVTSPSPENLSTLFEFIFNGLETFGYKRGVDYDVQEMTGAIKQVDISKNRNHRQRITYVKPDEMSSLRSLHQTELLVIDEAAAIPLPIVKNMLGPYLTFMASTINGYEGTGRSLSLKLLQQLRSQSNGRLIELTLNEPVRYNQGDAIETWLVDLLCLDSTNLKPLDGDTPPPDECLLYYVNRDTLFSYRDASEAFLQQIVGLFVSSHYKNTPNDLLMLADAPGHHIFCLTKPPTETELPEVLVAVQVCLEGALSEKSISDGFSRGKRASGDLIPWTVSQQFQDNRFGTLWGGRIVRISTRPECQGAGYGGRAMRLLRDYYRVAAATTEEIKSGALLMRLNERPVEYVDYLGVAYGLTEDLLKFWKRSDFVPVYLRQTTNELTGEHTCVMINDLRLPGGALKEYYVDFRRRFVNLCSFEFAKFGPGLALSLLNNRSIEPEKRDLNGIERELYLTGKDLKRLEMYGNNMADYHLVVDLVPNLATMYHLNLTGKLQLSAVQGAVLLGVGLQRKGVDVLAAELGLAPAQVLGMFNKCVRSCVQYLRSSGDDCEGRPGESGGKKKKKKSN